MSPQATMERVSFETTCFRRHGATLQSGDVAKKLKRVAQLQRQVARTTRAGVTAETLDPEQIGALLFQGGRLVTAHADGKLIGYAVAAKPGTTPLCQLVVAPQAARLPVGTALLERLVEASARL